MQAHSAQRLVRPSICSRALKRAIEVKLMTLAIFARFQRTDHLGDRIPGAAHFALAPGYLLPPALQARCLIDRNLSEGFCKTLLKKQELADLLHGDTEKDK